MKDVNSLSSETMQAILEQIQDISSANDITKFGLEVAKILYDNALMDESVFQTLLGLI